VSKAEFYLKQIREWEYCYCTKCEWMRYGSELEVTEDGIRCSKCGSYALEPPGWVPCPHQKVAAVKCPRGGRGIVVDESGSDCKYRCTFR